MQLRRLGRGSPASVPVVRQNTQDLTAPVVSTSNPALHPLPPTVVNLVASPPACLHACISCTRPPACRFMQTAIASSPSGSRRRWRKGGGVSGYGSPYRPTTPLPAEGEATGKPSRFGFQTPPPGSGNKSGDTAASHADDFAAAASELSPTSFSGMINRLFSSQSGVTDGGDITALAGGSPAAGDGDGSVDGAAMPTAPIAAAREAAPVGASLSSRSPPRTRPRAPASPLRRRPPSSPCPATNPSQIGGTSGGKGRARSAGYSGGGSSVRDLGCDTSNINKFGRSGGAREEHIPGMFSDDESESDAGCSPDRDGPVIAAAAAEATDSLPVTHSNSSHSGSNFDSRGGAKGRHPTNVDQWSDGRDSLGLDFGQGLNGAPVLREGRAEEPGTPTTPPGVTMRTRVAKPRVVAAAAAAATAVPREESPRWSVLVEKCYVMVSCHRNHPLMFKVRERQTCMRSSANLVDGVQYPALPIPSLVSRRCCCCLFIAFRLSHNT